MRKARVLEVVEVELHQRQAVEVKRADVRRQPVGCLVERVVVDSGADEGEVLEGLKVDEHVTEAFDCVGHGLHRENAPEEPSGIWALGMFKARIRRTRFGMSCDEVDERPGFPLGPSLDGVAERNLLLQHRLDGIYHQKQGRRVRQTARPSQESAAPTHLANLGNKASWKKHWSRSRI